jgi:hypothetical protein
MPSFLVEMYVADDPSALAEVERVARQAASLAVDVRLVRTTFLPSDELALHLFEAPSAEVLDRLARHAGLRYDRMVGALEPIDPPRAETPAPLPTPRGVEPKEET